MPADIPTSPLPALPTATTPTSVLGAAPSATTPSTVLGAAPSATTPGTVLGAAPSATTPGTVLDALIVPAAAAVTITPTGANNDIVVTAKNIGLAGNDLSIDLVIDAATDRTQLTVAEVAGDVTVTSGDKRMMRVTGNLQTSTGVSVAGDYLYDGTLNSAPKFKCTLQDGSSVTIYVGFDLTEESPRPYRYLVNRIVGSGISAVSELLARSDSMGFGTANTTPDLATGWANRNASTGTPVVTASPATAAQVIAAINAALDLPITAANAAANDGTGSIAAVAATSLTGGVGIIAPTSPIPAYDPTAVPPTSPLP